MSGPDVLSGGALRVEGSLLAILVRLLVSLALLIQARRQHHFIRPFWQRFNGLPEENIPRCTLQRRERSARL